MKNKYISILLAFLMVLNVLAMFTPVNAQENSGIFLITDSYGWNIAGFNNSSLPVYNKEGLTKFFMPIALKKEDVPNLLDKDVEHTIYNDNHNFTDRLLSVDFEILESNTYYVILYSMVVKASTNDFNIDFIPKIKGEELYQYAWWNSTWDYSKSSSICNSVTDYQVKLTVGNVSGGDVNCSGNAQSDFDDIRFTKGDNATELHYWMENYTTDVQATFWVNISDATTICMYYGNDAVSTTSNGANTFIYFDDWTNDNTGDWWSFRERDPTDDTANNVYNITGGIGYNNRLRYRHTTSEWLVADTGATLRIGFCSDEWDVTHQYPSNYIVAMTSSDIDDGSTAIIQSWNCYSNIGSVAFVDTDPFSDSAYYIRDTTIISTEFKSTHYKDDGTLMSTTFMSGAGIPNAVELDNLVMFTYVDTGTSFFTHNAGDGELTVGGYRTTSKNVMSIDWMFLGEYASTEPTFCDWSSEFTGVTYTCPEFSFSDVTPTHGSTTVNYLIANLSVTINSSTGDTFNYTIHCSNGNTTSANNVGNGTYNLPVCCLEQEILYYWYVNVTHNVTCGWTNVTYNFTTVLSECLCTDELTAILNEFRTLNENLEGDTIIEMDTTQFIILILSFLFCVFMWIGYIIPSIEGSTKSLHYIPFSGGLFVMFGALDFISLSILLTTNYSLGIIGGFLVTIGIILLIYGVLKAFYYD